MIIYVSLLYFAGNFLDSVGILVEILGVDAFSYMPIYIVIGNVFLFSSHSLNIFIYYKADKDYNRLFRRLLLGRKRLTRLSGSRLETGSSPRRRS